MKLYICYIFDGRVDFDNGHYTPVKAVFDNELAARGWKSKAGDKAEIDCIEMNEVRVK